MKDPKSVNKSSKNYMPSDQHDQLAKIVGANLDKLRRRMGWNKTHFADQTGIPITTLNNYLTGKRLATTEYLVFLTQLPVFKEAGILLTLDQLVSDTADFTPRPVRGIAPVLPRDSRLAETFLGVYVCYRHDQSAPSFLVKDDPNDPPHLLYGVVVVLRESDQSVGAYACFLKNESHRSDEEQRSVAHKLKRTLEDHYTRNHSGNVLENAIRREFSLHTGDVYKGTVYFSHNLAYLNLQKEDGDEGLANIVINATPPKGMDKYLGGLGTVSYGMNSTPVMDTVILSKHEITHTSERIAALLRDCSVDPSAYIQDIDLFFTQINQIPLSETVRRDILQARMARAVKDCQAGTMRRSCAISESRIHDLYVFLLENTLNR